MPRSKLATRNAILDATELVLKRDGANATTMDAVASAAGCAKGLVHYHFDTKDRLLVEAALRIGAAREAAWLEALQALEPHEAIDRSWEVLLREAESGAIRAWASLSTSASEGVDRTVKRLANQFRGKISEATRLLLERAGLTTPVPAEQLGWLLAAVIHGMGFQLAAGAAARDLENAYAAAWLGILSLATPSGQ